MALNGLTLHGLTDRLRDASLHVYIDEEKIEVPWLGRQLR